jgi:hypothetical protein
MDKTKKDDLVTKVLEIFIRAALERVEIFTILNQTPVYEFMPFRVSNARDQVWGLFIMEGLTSEECNEVLGGCFEALKANMEAEAIAG